MFVKFVWNSKFVTNGIIVEITIAVQWLQFKIPENISGIELAFDTRNKSHINCIVATMLNML